MYGYNMHGKPMKTVNEESNFRVTVNFDMKTTKHCRSAEKKRASTMFTFIARNFEYKTPEVMLSLYNSTVRPRMEYAFQFWFLIYRKGY